MFETTHRGFTLAEPLDVALRRLAEQHGDAPDDRHHGGRMLDFGPLRLRVPDGAQLHGADETGDPSAMQLSVPAGRVSLSVLTTSWTEALWPRMAEEIVAARGSDGAQVSTEWGEWGQEVLAHSNGERTRFIGVDGPGSMLYGVAAGPEERTAELTEVLYGLVRGSEVHRGDEHLPVRTALTLTPPGLLGREPMAPRRPLDDQPPHDEQPHWSVPEQWQPPVPDASASNPAEGPSKGGPVRRPRRTPDAVTAAIAAAILLLASASVLAIALNVRHSGAPTVAAPVESATALTPQRAGTDGTAPLVTPLTPTAPAPVVAPPAVASPVATPPVAASPVVTPPRVSGPVAAAPTAPVTVAPPVATPAGAAGSATANRPTAQPADADRAGHEAPAATTRRGGDAGTSTDRDSDRRTAAGSDNGRAGSDNGSDNGRAGDRDNGTDRSSDTERRTHRHSHHSARSTDGRAENRTDKRDSRQQVLDSGLLSGLTGLVDQTLLGD